MSVALPIDLELLKTELDEYGFVIIPNLILKDDAERMGRRIVEIITQRPDYDPAKPDQGLKGGLFNNLTPDDYPLFVSLLTNPVYLDLARHVLGDGFQITDSGPIWTKPGSLAQRLHADVPIGWFAKSGLRIPNICFVVNAIWMLTDFAKENGATQLMPFSHHATGAGRIPRSDVEYRDLVTAEGPAGSIVIFNGSLWHRRGANVTQDRERVGVSTFYFGSWLDPRTPAVNWSSFIIRRSVRDQLPELVQQMSRHVVED